MRKHYVVAIDPANVESGWVVLDAEDYRPIAHGKTENDLLRERLMSGYLGDFECDGHDEVCFVIEMVSSYGMPVGREVFETCVWIGRFMEVALNAKRGYDRLYCDPDLIYRREVKLNLCGQTRAKDSNVRQALIDRFASTPNGKGTKANPDWFYGFKADEWSAAGVAVVFIDQLKGLV